MIQGIIVKIQSQKENDWGRYTLDSYGKETLAVGVIPGASLGMSVTLEGGMETNKYGTQFKISSVLSTESDEFSGVRTFLSDGYVKGIGIKTANEMIKMYGKDCLDLFETEAGRKKLEKVKGLGEKSIANALPSYLDNKKYKDIVLFLNGAGTKDQIEKIYEKYGEKTLRTLKKNPYCLQMDLKGFGFKKTDAIALGMGIKKDSIYRIMAGVKYVIEEAQTNEGHCYLPIETITERVIPLLVPLPRLKDITEKVGENALEDWTNNKEKLIKAHNPCAETLKNLSETAQSRELIGGSLTQAIEQAVEDGYLVNEDGRIYTDVMYSTETAVAKHLTQMCRRGAKPVKTVSTKTIEETIKEVEKRKTAELRLEGKDIAFEVTEEQKEAVYLGLTNRLSIISGGPGRGKTAISEIIAKAFINSGHSHNKSDILMLAPTGKAARRIKESTGYDAMTVHKAVMALKLKEEPPKGKLILVDESSMVDIFLMLDIMKYAQDCNLIFVGDVDQIASVGPGKVLRDMIDSEMIPCIILKQGHRNSGSIAKNSAAINDGLKLNSYIYDEHFVYKGTRPIFETTPEGEPVRDASGEYVIRVKATELMQDKLINDYLENVKKYGIQNVMLCVAMKERGDVCTTRLNEKIQDIRTAGQPTAIYGKRRFRVGDRVMQIKNDYNFPKLSEEKKITNGVCNGETGTVIKIEPDIENDSMRMVIQFDDGCYGGYTKNTAQNLQLAYAITVHKCQGSEAKCVMMAYSYGDYMLLNRSLFYTGVTRSKEVCFLYGEERFQYGKWQSAFNMAVSRTMDAKRNTTLSDRLKDMALDMTA